MILTKFTSSLFLILATIQAACLPLKYNKTEMFQSANSKSFLCEFAGKQRSTKQSNSVPLEFIHRYVK